MSIIKLASDAFLRSGKHGGSCVQLSGQGLSIKNNAHGRQWRSIAQYDYKSFMLYAAKAWRALNPATRFLWDSWAAAYPQPTLKDNTVFLSGYELFVKRNYYLYLSYRETFVFMTNPAFVEHSEEVLTPRVKVDETKIEIDCSFALKTGAWDCLLFISREKSPGLSFGSTSYRFVNSVYSVNQTVDVTELYLSNFGVLPVVGQSIFISVVMCGRDNGQFSFHNLYSLLIEPTTPPFTPINWALLYNLFSVLDARGLANVGWHVITDAEFTSLTTFAGGVTVAGGKLKEAGLVHWLSPNTGAADDFLFAMTGSGVRTQYGEYNVIGNSGYLWASNSFPPYGFNRIFYYNFAKVDRFLQYRTSGLSVRLARNSLSGWSPGETYTDFDGHVYPTILINGVVYLGRNLIVRHFRDGSVINFHGAAPNYFTASEWSALTSAGCCPPVIRDGWSYV